MMDCKSVANRKHLKILSQSKMSKLLIMKLAKSVFKSTGLGGILAAVAICWGGASSVLAQGDSVVVVYNSSMPESKKVADYYALMRQVPPDQVIGLDLPKSEAMSRTEFRDRLQKPLFERFEERKFFTFKTEPKPNGSGKRAEMQKVIADAKIRYMALCYGVPVKISNEPTWSEANSEKIRAELRKNEAAVDSELALLPVMPLNPPIYGLLGNRLYGTTNAASLHPTNGVLMVARLDGPSAGIAMGLVDKAVFAERMGLWGRAYFDARGITEGSYRLGDDWIQKSGQLAKNFGFETVVDTAPNTFSKGFPLSEVGLYAGWYDTHVSGPFSQPEVEFMEGAFAYHLHSFSASTIRSPNAHWVGPLLAKGAAATMGCVFEPYLEGTPDLPVFFSRFLYGGYSFGEAAYACQNSLSWQTTVVGDPLYRPFAKKPRTQHEELAAAKSKLIEWSHLRVVNLNQVTDLPMSALIAYFMDISETQESGVLLEKLADLYYLEVEFSKSIATYKLALQKSTSKLAKVRITMSLARTLELSGQRAEAFDVYRGFLKEHPDYPDALAVYRKLLPLAEQLNRSADKEEFEKEIRRLDPAAAAAVKS